MSESLSEQQASHAACLSALLHDAYDMLKLERMIRSAAYMYTQVRGQAARVQTQASQVGPEQPGRPR